MSDTVHIDVCGLEPPEPLERILEALSALTPEQKLCIIIDREPLPLYRILANNGYTHEAQTRPDYRYEILVSKSASSA